MRSQEVIRIAGNSHPPIDQYDHVLADALDISRLIQGRNLHVRPRRIAGCERHRPVRTPRSPDRIRKSHVIDIRSRSSFNLFDCRSA